ncbi:MAG TPA: hypothetical protein VE194_11550, partial [Rubrobacter sp.]|nr:hypothetical protein [Rubrobacter sp.]
PLWAWLVFIGLVLALLFVDLFLLHRDAREVPFKEAIWLSVFWIAVSLAFGGFVWFLAGVAVSEAVLVFLLARLRAVATGLDALPFLFL